MGKHCEGVADNDPACWEMKYRYLDENNEKEWWMSLIGTWNALGWMGLLGPLIIAQSCLSIVDVLIWPETKPDISQDWSEMGDFDVWYLDWVTFVASMGMPSMFWITQLFSDGESNFSDFSLFYMEPEDASLYFMYNTFWAVMHYPYSLIHIVLFGWVYIIQLAMWGWEQIFESEEKEMRYGKDGGMGGKGGPGGQGPPQGKDEDYYPDERGYTE